MRATLPVVMSGLCAVALTLGAARIIWHSYAGAVRDFLRNPAGPLTLDPAVAAVPHLQSVTFGADATRMLAAWYVPSRGGAAVILVHGTGAERASLLAETRLLSEAGFGVLTLDTCQARD